MPDVPPLALVGDDVVVPCVDGVERSACSLDAAASTAALPAVLDAVTSFVPLYSSVHRGAGWKSQRATDAYETAREAVLRFAGRPVDGDDVAVLCRNTTEAINHIAYRLDLHPSDVVVTTVVEHHANLLPWRRMASQRWVECGVDGTFTLDDVRAALAREAGPKPRLLAVTGASNVTGWLPPLDEIIAVAHAAGVPVLVDAAQLAPHRPLPAAADFIAFSGHKLYAPFGTSAFIGPRSVFASGDPFLAGGGAVDLVDLDEVVWTDPPEREEAGSPNVVGAVALHAALDELERGGGDGIAAPEPAVPPKRRNGRDAIDGVRLLGPPAASGIETLALASFDLEDQPHALVAARLSAEFGIATRHGCFCAHPYLLRLLDLSDDEVASYRAHVLRGDRRTIPGAVRASAGINTTLADVDRLLDAVARIASGGPPPVEYEQDEHTGDWWPAGDLPGWSRADRAVGASCARG